MHLLRNLDPLTLAALGIFGAILIYSFLPNHYKTALQRLMSGVANPGRPLTAPPAAPAPSVAVVQTTLDELEEPVVCLVDLHNLDYTQRLHCYKALHNHVKKVKGDEAARKLDTDLLPLVIDDAA